MLNRKWLFCMKKMGVEKRRSIPIVPWKIEEIFREKTFMKLKITIFGRNFRDRVFHMSKSEGENAVEIEMYGYRLEIGQITSFTRIRQNIAKHNITAHYTIF